VEPFDEAESAATVIQSSFRRKRDGKRAKEQSEFKGVNEVEIDAEVAFLRQNETLCAVDNLLERSDILRRTTSVPPVWMSKARSPPTHAPLPPTSHLESEIVFFTVGRFSGGGKRLHRATFATEAHSG